MPGTQSSTLQQTESKEAQNHSKTQRKQPVNWRIFLTDLAILVLRSLCQKLETHSKSLEEKFSKCLPSSNTSQSNSSKSLKNSNRLSRQSPTSEKHFKRAKAYFSRKKTREKK